MCLLSAKDDVGDTVKIFLRAIEREILQAIMHS